MSDLRRRAKYTQEFKEESVRQVLAGASVGSVASSLGIPKASLGNWVRQQARGEGGVRLATNPSGAASPRATCRQGAGPTADASPWPVFTGPLSCY